MLRKSDVVKNQAEVEKIRNEVNDYMAPLKNHPASYYENYDNLTRKQVEEYYKYCLSLQKDFLKFVNKFILASEYHYVPQYYLELLTLAARISHFQAFSELLESFLDKVKDQKKFIKDSEEDHLAKKVIFHMSSFYYCSSEQKSQDKKISNFAKILIEKGADVNYANPDMKNHTPLHRSAIQGYETFTKTLLTIGKAEVNKLANKGITPLIAVTCISGFLSPTIVQLLLAHGADINHSDNLGATALSNAIRNGHTNIVQLFLEKKVNIESSDIYGLTPLAVAAMCGYPMLVRLLLKNGANVHASEGKVTYALYAAICSSSEEQKVPKNTRNQCVASLLKAGANSNSMIKVATLDDDTSGYDTTPLFTAVTTMDAGLVRMLIESNKSGDITLSASEFLKSLKLKELHFSFKFRMLVVFYKKDLAFFKENNTEEELENIEIFKKNSPQAEFAYDISFLNFVDHCLKSDLVNSDKKPIEINVNEIAWMTADKKIMELLPIQITDEYGNELCPLREPKKDQSPITSSESNKSTKVVSEIENILISLKIECEEVSKKIQFKSSRPEHLNTLKDQIKMTTKYSQSGPAKKDKSSPFILTVSTSKVDFFNNHKLIGVLQAKFKEIAVQDKAVSPSSNVIAQEAPSKEVSNKIELPEVKERLVVRLNQDKQKIWIENLRIIFSDAEEVKIVWQEKEAFFSVHFPENNQWTIRPPKGEYQYRYVYRLTNETVLAKIRNRVADILQQTSSFIQMVNIVQKNLEIYPGKEDFSTDVFKLIAEEIYKEISQEGSLVKKIKIQKVQNDKKVKPEYVKEAKVIQKPEDAWRDLFFSLMMDITKEVMEGENLLSKFQGYLFNFENKKIKFQISYKAKTSLHTIFGALDTKKIVLEFFNLFEENMKGRVSMKLNNEDDIILTFKMTSQDLERIKKELPDLKRIFKNKVCKVKNEDFSYQLYVLKIQSKTDAKKSLDLKKVSKSKSYLIRHFVGENLTIYIDKLKEIPEPKKENISNEERNFFAFMFYSVVILQTFSHHGIYPVAIDKFYLINKVFFQEFYQAMMALLATITIQKSNAEMFFVFNRRENCKLVLSQGFKDATKKLEQLIESHQEKIVNHDLDKDHSKKASLFSVFEEYLKQLEKKISKEENEINNAAICMLYSVLGAMDKKGRYGVVYAELHKNIVEPLDQLFPRLKLLMKDPVIFKPSSFNRGLKCD